MGYFFKLACRFCSGCITYTIKVFNPIGTHWTWEIINMLLQGSPEYHRDSKTSFMLEAIPDLKALGAVPSPSVLNTHLPYRWLPRKHVENGGKIVHVIRNPKDVCVSMYHFLKGIPYMGTNIDKVTWEQYLDNFVFCDGKVHIKFRYRKKKY